MDKQKNASGKNFFDMLSAWLISLPSDIIILIKMVGDDELNMNARSLAAGTLIYILSPKAIKNGLLAMPPTHIVELLSNGLEEEQKRQIKEEEKQDQKRATEQLSNSLTEFRKRLGIGRQK